MAKQVVSTRKAPAAIGPYSQAVKAGGFLFASGQIALVAGTGEIVGGGVKEQTRRVLENIRELLGAAGCSMRDVVKTTVFLADMADFAAMNEVYGEYFRDDPPARSTVQVARLPRDAAIEIEVMAAMPG